MTAADLETGLGNVYQATVQSMKPPSASHTWRTVGFIILLVLFASAIGILTWQFTLRGEGEGEVTTDVHSAPLTDHQRMVKEAGRNKKAAIHLHVSSQDEGEVSVKWASDVDQAFSKGGLKLKDNAIVIPNDGIYFVYTQASFVVSCGSSEDRSSVRLSHAVEWSSPVSPSTPDKPNYLLIGVKSVCQATTKDEVVYDIIYLGAIFRLHKGDKLSTQTNNVNEIDDQSSKTFFGVFKL